MGLLSSAQKTALQGRGRAVPLVELTLPGGTWIIGPEDLASLTNGQYLAKILQQGTLVYGISDRSNRLESVEWEFDIDDAEDSALARLLEGEDGDAVGNSPAILKAGTEGVAPANWHTAFVGILGRFAMSTPFRWSMVLRPDDRALERQFPRQPITPADWPNAAAEVYGNFGPLLYGVHSSSGTTSKGMVPLILVDTVGFRYLVCQARGKLVERVYKDGTLLASTAWSTAYVTVNGRLWTLVTFTSDQEDAEITADVQGYETVGDGSGTLIESPSDVLKHILVNWVYGDYQAGNWLADATAPVDATAFATTKSFLDSFGHKASKRFYGEQRLAGDVINDWCGSLQIKAYWTTGGKLAVKPQDHRLLTVYLDDPWLRWDEHEFTFNLRYDDQQLLDRISVDYVYGEAAGQYLQTLEVRDPFLDFEAPDSLSLPWSGAFTI